MTLKGLGCTFGACSQAGLLSGKYRRGMTPEEGGRHELPIANLERLYDTIEILLATAEAREVSPTQWRSPGC